MNYIEQTKAAREKMPPSILRTPLFKSEFFSKQIGCKILLKCENLQVTGSFKPRGAFTFLDSLSSKQIESGLCTASGGNHGLAVCFAARQFDTNARVYLPKNTPEYKKTKIEALGGEVEWHGDVWDDANKYAKRKAREDGLEYVHAFNHERIILGQATIAHEILDDPQKADIIVCSIGGGGLISGIARYVKARNPSIRVYGVETVGADSMYQSLKAEKPVSLPDITSIAESLGASVICRQRNALRAAEQRQSRRTKNPIAWVLTRGVKGALGRSKRLGRERKDRGVASRVNGVA